MQRKKISDLQDEELEILKKGKMGTAKPEEIIPLLENIEITKNIVIEEWVSKKAQTIKIKRPLSQKEFTRGIGSLYVNRNTLPEIHRENLNIILQAIYEEANEVLANRNKEGKKVEQKVAAKPELVVISNRINVSGNLTAPFL